jgi:hypothetical protein
MRTWTLLPLLAASLAVASARAEDPPAKTLSSAEMAALLQRIGADLTALRNDVDALRKELRTEGVRGAQTTMDLADLQRRVDSLQDLVQRQNDTLRRAFSYTPPATPPAPATTGTIMLRNRSGYPGTFFVNDQSYLVMPGQSVEVRGVPVGTFTYEIQAEGFGVIRPRVTRTLTAGTPFYLNIDP